MSDLEQFVLSYLQEAGALVEPPAFQVYEVLLPDAAAHRWQQPTYLQLAFTETEQADATHLGYNHPFVERLAHEAHDHPASTRLIIDNLRLDKTGLDELAANNWGLVNARVQPQPRTTTARTRSTYLRFNFKAALLSDEKQERLVSVLMDAHTGNRIANAEAIEARAAAPTSDTILDTLPPAPMRWQPPDGQPLKLPLDNTSLQALLVRAQEAVRDELGDDLINLQKRVARFRELDEARLNDYYGNLRNDLHQRLKNALPDRRASLQGKLDAVKTEHAHKLADLAERYQLQIHLTLLNLMVIQQAKLVLPVLITNRNTQVEAYAVWDPLLYRLEPLLCQVCGLPGDQRMHLCHNGHIAHETCLAPACVDCKRVFCQECAGEVGECAVCHQPLCRHSQLKCKDCGRVTCQAHRTLCHANEGQPIDLNKPAPPPVPEPEPEPTPPPKVKRKSAAATPKSPPLAPSKPTPIKMPKGVPTPKRIELVVKHHELLAYVLGARDKEIAFRIWSLEPMEGGIIRRCECEKGQACQNNGVILRPMEWQPIAVFINKEIEALLEEYGLTWKQVNFNRHIPIGNGLLPMSKLELFGLWLDAEALKVSRVTFDRLYGKKING